MKIKSGFELREILGEHVILSYGTENINFNKVIHINESAVALWKAAEKAGEFTAQTLAEALTEEYEVEYEVALSDAESMIKQWIQEGLVEE